MTTTTYTQCYVASTAVPPLTTPVSWSRTSHPVDYAVFTYNNVSATCENFNRCGSRLHSNADITGVGVIAAFLIAAWVTLVFLLGAYWGGLLPPELLRAADRQIFSANSRNSLSGWKDAVYHVTLILSDQQLVTGLAVLIAGYYALAFHNLDIFHWQQITYLAWLSSTVHLISLSVLREQLNARRLLRNVRLAGMLILLAMLLAALTPSAGMAAEYGLPQMPARCLWHAKQYIYQEPSPLLPGDLDHSDNEINISCVVSYLTLIISYVWKLSQLSNGSRGWIRNWGRVVPETALESAMKRCLDDPGHQYGLSLLWRSTKYKILEFLYLFWAVWAECLESFLATILLLLFALTWGTVKLLLPRVSFRVSQLSSENQMTFGQLLPLLLLLQPALAILEHIGSTTLILRSRDRLASSGASTPNDSKPTLRDVLRNRNMSSSLEKASEEDLGPVIEYLYTLRAFRTLIRLHIFGVLGTGAGILLFRMNTANNYMLIFLSTIVVAQQLWLAICCGGAMIFSKHLR